MIPETFLGFSKSVWFAVRFDLLYMSYLYCYPKLLSKNKMNRRSYIYTEGETLFNPSVNMIIIYHFFPGRVLLHSS